VRTAERSSPSCSGRSVKVRGAVTTTIKNRIRTRVERRRRGGVRTTVQAPPPVFLGPQPAPSSAKGTGGNPPGEWSRPPPRLLRSPGRVRSGRARPRQKDHPRLLDVGAQSRRPVGSLICLPSSGGCLRGSGLSARPFLFTASLPSTVVRRSIALPLQRRRATLLVQHPP
jgi:hypothetical protein